MSFRCAFYGILFFIGEDMKKTPIEEKRKFDLGSYYDDILPDDADEVNIGVKDNALTLRIIILGFFVVLVLSACVAVLVLLGGEGR